MSVSLSGRSFLKLLDFTPDEIRYLLDLSADLKAKKRAHEPHRYLEGRNVALVFEKTSTRTRCAFEVGYLDPSASQIGKKESIADTARVLGRMFDGIEYRGFGQERVEELAAYAGVPVWNGLTTEFHPTQMLADVLTMEEEFGRGGMAGRKVTFMGDAGNNVGNSLMVVCAKLGIDFCACGPAEQMPSSELVEACREVAAGTGSTITLTADVDEGARGASVIYTDIWVSMGEPESVWAERIAALAPYQVNAALMAKADPNAIFMHCLPAYHDKKTAIGNEMCTRFGREAMEVTDDVFESAQSVVFQEAENRMHTIKAVMAATLAEIEL